MFLNSKTMTVPNNGAKNLLRLYSTSVPSHK